MSIPVEVLKFRPTAVKEAGSDMFPATAAYPLSVWPGMNQVK
jgi:hypothetical protein